MRGIRGICIEHISPCCLNPYYSIGWNSECEIRPLLAFCLKSNLLSKIIFKIISRESATILPSISFKDFGYWSNPFPPYGAG